MKRVLNIVGPNAAGKDTSAAYLAGIFTDAQRCSISDPLVCHFRRQGITPTRQQLIDYNRELIKADGGGDSSILAKLAINAASSDVLILTGMRQPAQAKWLDQNTTALTIAIDAEAAIRYERARKHGKGLLGTIQTLEDFISFEIAENSNPNPQRVREIMELASFSVSNNGTVKELHAQLSAHMSEIRSRLDPTT